MACEEHDGGGVEANVGRGEGCLRVLPEPRPGGGEGVRFFVIDTRTTENLIQPSAAKRNRAQQHGSGFRLDAAVVTFAAPACQDLASAARRWRRPCDLDRACWV